MTFKDIINFFNGKIDGAWFEKYSDYVKFIYSIRNALKLAKI
jgi:hypothetical protein